MAELLVDHILDRQSTTPSPTEPGTPPRQAAGSAVIEIDRKKAHATIDGIVVALRSDPAVRLIDLLGKNGPDYTPGDVIKARCGIADVHQSVRRIRKKSPRLAELLESCKSGYRLRPGTTVRIR